LLIIIGTTTFTLRTGVVDGSRRRRDAHLQHPRSEATITDPWLKIFTAAYASRIGIS
jgi:hypothetical protein